MPQRRAPLAKIIDFHHDDEDEGDVGFKDNCDYSLGSGFGEITEHDLSTVDMTAHDADMKETSKSHSDSTQEERDLKKRLIRRTKIIEEIRKAYLRDVVTIKHVLKEVLTGTEREAVIRQYEFILPSVDLRQALVLHAPDNAEFRIKHCDSCGGTFDVNINDSREVTILQEHVSKLRDQEQKLRVHVATQDAKISRLTNEGDDITRAHTQEKRFLYAEMKKVKADIEAAREDITKLQKENSKVRKREEVLRVKNEELMKLALQLEVLEVEHRELQTTVVITQETIRKQADNQESVESSVADLSQELHAMTEERNTLQVELKQCHHDLFDSRDKQIRYKELAESVELSLGIVNSKVLELEQQLSNSIEDAKLAKQSAASEMEALDRVAETLRTEVRLLEEQLKQSQIENVDYKAEIVELNADLGESDEIVRELEDDLVAAAEEAEALSEEMEALKHFLTSETGPRSRKGKASDDMLKSSEEDMEDMSLGDDNSASSSLAAGVLSTPQGSSVAAPNKGTYSASVNSNNSRSQKRADRRTVRSSIDMTAAVTITSSSPSATPKRPLYRATAVASPTASSPSRPFQALNTRQPYNDSPAVTEGIADFQLHSFGFAEHNDFEAGEENGASPLTAAVPAMNIGRQNSTTERTSTPTAAAALSTRRATRLATASPGLGPTGGDISSRQATSDVDDSAGHSRIHSEHRERRAGGTAERAGGRYDLKKAVGLVHGHVPGSPASSAAGKSRDGKAKSKAFVPPPEVNVELIELPHDATCQEVMMRNSLLNILTISVGANSAKRAVNACIGVIGTFGGMLTEALKDLWASLLMNKKSWDFYVKIKAVFDGVMSCRSASSSNEIAKICAEIVPLAGSSVGTKLSAIWAKQVGVSDDIVNDLVPIVNYDTKAQTFKTAEDFFGTTETRHFKKLELVESTLSKMTVYSDEQLLVLSGVLVDVLRDWSDAKTTVTSLDSRIEKEIIDARKDLIQEVSQLTKELQSVAGKYEYAREQLRSVENKNDDLNKLVAELTPFGGLLLNSEAELKALKRVRAQLATELDASQKDCKQLEVKLGASKRHLEETEDLLLKTKEALELEAIRAMNFDMQIGHLTFERDDLKTRLGICEERERIKLECMFPMGIQTEPPYIADTGCQTEFLCPDMSLRTVVAASNDTLRKGFPYVIATSCDTSMDDYTCQKLFSPPPGVGNKGNTSVTGGGFGSRKKQVFLDDDISEFNSQVPLKISYSRGDFDNSDVIGGPNGPLFYTNAVQNHSAQSLNNCLLSGPAQKELRNKFLGPSSHTNNNNTNTSAGVTQSHRHGSSSLRASLDLDVALPTVMARQPSLGQGSVGGAGSLSGLSLLSGDYATGRDTVPPGFSNSLADSYNERQLIADMLSGHTYNNNNNMSPGSTRQPSPMLGQGRHNSSSVSVYSQNSTGGHQGGMSVSVSMGGGAGTGSKKPKKGGAGTVRVQGNNNVANIQIGNNIGGVCGSPMISPLTSLHVPSQSNQKSQYLLSQSTSTLPSASFASGKERVSANTIAELRKEFFGK